MSSNGDPARTVRDAESTRVLEVLTEAECRRLLGTAVIGRLAYTDGALPAIQPLSFTVLGNSLLLPTRAGSKVHAASRGAVVAFEVDDFDPVARTGWNVTVTGASRVVTDADEVAALDLLDTWPWAPAEQRCYVRVQIGLLAGRRIRCGRTP